MSIKIGGYYAFQFTQIHPGSEYVIKILDTMYKENFLVRCTKNNSHFVIGHRNKDNSEGVGISKNSVFNTYARLENLNIEMYSHPRFVNTLINAIADTNVPVGFAYFMHRTAIERFFLPIQVDIYLDLENRLSKLNI